MGWASGPGFMGGFRFGFIGGFNGLFQGGGFIPRAWRPGFMAGFMPGFIPACFGVSCAKPSHVTRHKL